MELERLTKIEIFCKYLPILRSLVIQKSGKDCSFVVFEQSKDSFDSWLATLCAVERLSSVTSKANDAARTIFK